MNLHTAPANLGQRPGLNPRDPDWQKNLPEEWRTAVIAPLDFATWQDYEMPAARCLGYDEDGTPCYYRHMFLLDALRWDDDEEFYPAIVYGEDVHAWRLRDDRWLIWRVVQQEDDTHSGRGFYRFSDSLPR